MGAIGWGPLVAPGGHLIPCQVAFSTSPLTTERRPPQVISSPGSDTLSPLPCSREDICHDLIHGLGGAPPPGTDPMDGMPAARRTPPANSWAQGPSGMRAVEANHEFPGERVTSARGKGRGAPSYSCFTIKPLLYVFGEVHKRTRTFQNFL